MRIALVIFYILIVAACHYNNERQETIKREKDSIEIKQPNALPEAREGKRQINTGNTTPEQLIGFAKLLIGVPYRYGATDPVSGFDCSGFVTYVFNHFNISVPRSSIDFTNYDTKVELSQAKPGDIILFTGTDSTVREVGHMAIITAANNNQIEFIHSSSGKANGVTITPLDNYYMGRFVKVIRVFQK